MGGSGENKEALGGRIRKGGWMGMVWRMGVRANKDKETSTHKNRKRRKEKEEKRKKEKGKKERKRK